MVTFRIYTLRGVQFKEAKRSSLSKSYGHPSKQAKPFVVIHDFSLLNLDTNDEVNNNKPKTVQWGFEDRLVRYFVGGNVSDSRMVWYSDAIWLPDNISGIQMVFT